MTDCLIWIVDDDADDLELISQAFKECSFEVRTFSSPDPEKITGELEKSYLKDLPEVILLDLNMPIISGKELLSHIRNDARFKHIPVVMFTTSNSKRDRIECLQLGANCFLTKPNSYANMVKICASLATVFCTPEFSNHK
jgi:CheY-like chemotaxis protein